MSNRDFPPGDDGELPTIPEAPKSGTDSQPDTPLDWYGQTSQKRKNDGHGTSNNTGTHALIIGAALFVMAFVLVVAAALLIRLSGTPQVLLIVTATPPALPTRIALLATLTPNSTLPSFTPMPLVSPTPPAARNSPVPPTITRTISPTVNVPFVSPTPPQITFYPAFTPVGMDATLTAQPQFTSVAFIPSPTAWLVSDTLTVTPINIATEAPTSSANLVVQITVHERVPLRIAVDDQVVYSGVPITNTVLKYQAKTSVRVKTGDAGGIDVVVNGVQQPPLGPSHMLADITYSITGVSATATLPAPMVIAPNDCTSFTADPSLPKIGYETNVAGGWNIYVADPSVGLFCRLTQSGSLTANHAYQPAWSPDGKRIVFVSDRANGFQLYTMNADGTFQQQLTNNNVSNYRPTWSPDGSRIAFVEQIDKTVFELHIINADGTNSRLLVNDSRASYPAWSPDGSKLVYDSLHNGDDLFYIADGNGGNPAKLFDNGLSTTSSHISWSPDGARLVFDSSRSGRPQVYVANADGTGLKQLTSSKGWNYNACWLSDQQIVFASTRDGHAVIYLMNADGSAQQPVTQDAAGISDDNPACSSLR